MSARPNIDDRQTSPAALYSEKYAWLMRWAMHFCNKDRSAAEDLVQDVFMQMLVSWPTFQAAGEPEKLLYTYLKYSFLLKCRKDRRYSFQTLSVIDFESLHLSLRREAFADSLEVQEGLLRIVRYLNWRKQQAKAASILLFRFFHGFFPSEIMQIAILTRRSVDNGLAQAREEAKGYIADPAKLNLVFKGAAPASSSLRSVLPPEEFVIALRTEIFESCFGACLPEAVLRDRYLGSAQRSIECELLAHIVSCRRCLNLVSGWCRLPSLEERLPEEAWGFAPKERATGTAGPVISSLKNAFNGGDARGKPARRNEQVLSSMRGGEQRFRAVYEHRPKALMIAVDGQVLATRDISSMISQLNIEMNGSAPKELIEVMSEQELPLLTVPMTISAGEGPPCIEYRGVLSDGRSICLRVRFMARGVLLELEYCDPSLAPDPIAHLGVVEDLQPEALEVRMPDATKIHLKPQRRDEVETPVTEQKKAAAAKTEPFLSRISEVMSYIWRLLTPQVLLVSGALAALVVAFALWSGRSTLPSANVLLTNAAMERVKKSSAGREGVIVQSVRFRASAATANTSFERQLPSDARGRRRRTNAAPRAEEQKRVAAKLAAADVSWDDPLSAANYRDWHDHANVTRNEVEQAGNGNLILTSFVSDGVLTSESLTVRAADFHPVAREIDYRDREKIEIAEVDFTVIPWSQADPRWFEPNPVAAHVQAPHVGMKLPRPLAPPPTQGQLDEAELGVDLGLSQVGADKNERLQIARTADGVHVDGLVADEKRKQEIISRLAQVPHTILNVLTFQEFEQQQKSPVPAQETGTAPIVIAAQSTEPSPLERLMQQKGMSAEDAGKLAHRFFANSVSLQQSAAALDKLQQRFRPTTLTADASRILGQLQAAQLDRLHAAIKDQGQVLREAAVSVAASGASEAAPIPSSAGEHPQQATLSSQANLHARFCTELISQSAPSNRAPQAILFDMAQSLVAIARLAEQNEAEQAHQDFNPALGATTQER